MSSYKERLCLFVNDNIKRLNILIDNLNRKVNQERFAIHYLFLKYLLESEKYVIEMGGDKNMLIR